MQIIDLNTELGNSIRPKVEKELKSLETLIAFLKQRDLKTETVNSVNSVIESLNKKIPVLQPKKKYGTLRDVKMKILKIVEKE